MLNRLTHLAFAIGVVASSASNAAAAGRPWREIRSRDVIVYGQQSPSTLRDIAIQLEQFRVVLGDIIKGAKNPQSLPTEVYVFDDPDAIRPYVPLYGGKPASLGGYCRCGSTDDGSLIVVGMSRYAETTPIIFHEYTHLLLRNALERPPVWLNEGLAEYFSTLGQPIGRHIQTLRERMLPVSDIIDTRQSSALYNEASRKGIFYAEAWALTHYLLTERPDSAAILNRYLETATDHDPNPAALVDATGLSLKQLDVELRRYINRSSYRAVRITNDARIEIAEPSAPRELPAAEAEARLADIQLHADRIDEAAPRVEAAAKAGPNVARAQLVLSFLRMRQGDLAGAFALTRRAAQLAPDDFATQYMYGLATLRGEDGDGDILTLERARSARQALARAVAINPRSAAALAWLAYADMSANEHLDEARELTQRAIALAPGRTDYAEQLERIEQLIALHNRPVTTVGPRVHLRLREVRAGEERIFGDLLEIACGPGGVRFVVRTASGTVTASAKRMSDVALISFGDDAKDFTVVCGARLPSDTVYLTRLLGSQTAVAVEFLPRGYVPQH